MRFSYRLKILLSLLVTTLLLLGGALFAVDRAYQQRVELLTRSRIDQGTRTFDRFAQHLGEELREHCFLAARSGRIAAQLLEGKSLGEVQKLVTYEMEFLSLKDDYIAVTQSDGAEVTRLLHKPDAPFRPGSGEPWPIAPSPDPTFAARVQVLAIARAAQAEQELPAVTPWIVESGRLFYVQILPVASDDRFVGVIVLGREITNEVVREFQQMKGDRAAYLVGGKFVADNFTADERGPALLAIGSDTFRVVRNRLGTSDVETLLFISIQELTDFRREMRTLILSLAVVAVFLSLIVSLLVSRSVTRPVADLAEGTVQIAAGKYATRIRVRSNDELGDLAGAFNQMAEDLATKEKVRAVLNKVVAPEVADELVKGDLSLGGDLVRATILFADLRGFTALTQGMPPQKTVAMLNEFMTAMTEEVLVCKGIVDKYVGDEIIGLFGVPRPRGADALAGVEAAHRMRLRLDTLNRVRTQRGDRPLQMGIGVHTGEVVAGRMGSEQQLSYTCIGENMNLASRLCSNAKAGQILMSIDTYRDAGDGVDARPLDPISVKGFDKPIPVYEVASVVIGATAVRRKG